MKGFHKISAAMSVRLSYAKRGFGKIGMTIAEREDTKKQARLPLIDWKGRK
jgi:hypothetical protein